MSTTDAVNLPTTGYTNRGLRIGSTVSWIESGEDVPRVGEVFTLAYPSGAWVIPDDPRDGERAGIHLHVATGDTNGLLVRRGGRPVDVETAFRVLFGRRGSRLELDAIIHPRSAGRIRGAMREARMQASAQGKPDRAASTDEAGHLLLDAIESAQQNHQIAS